VDKTVTEKTFKFADQYNLPFFYTSAAEGTNVVRVFYVLNKNMVLMDQFFFSKIFGEALKLGLDNKLNPPDQFMSDVMDLLNDVCLIIILNYFQI